MSRLPRLRCIFASTCSGCWLPKTLADTLDDVGPERQIRLVEHSQASTVFTRFIPPRSAEDMPGRWRRY